MLSLIKQFFIVLLSFTNSFVTKFLFLNDKPSVVRSALIDFDPVQLTYLHTSIHDSFR